MQEKAQKSTFKKFAAWFAIIIGALCITIALLGILAGLEGNLKLLFGGVVSLLAGISVKRS